MNRPGETVATLVYAVKRPVEGWELSEETMPESESHRSAGELLKHILEYWASRSGNGARIVANLGLRWVPEDARIGVDPDVAVLLPAPPVEKYGLDDYYMWLPDHPPPLVACEIVSRSNPIKDYSIAPAKYADNGTQELWIFDPRLAGIKAPDGPFRLQIFRRDGGALRRIYAGDGPAHSPALDAWLVVTNENRFLRIANDEAATDFWHTGEEAANRAAEAANRVAEAANRAKQASDRDKDAALAKVAELEARIAKLEGR